MKSDLSPEMVGVERKNLASALSRLGDLQRQKVDRIALDSIVRDLSSKVEVEKALQYVVDRLGGSLRWRKNIGEAATPLLMYSKVFDVWVVLRGKTPQGKWLQEVLNQSTGTWEEVVDSIDVEECIFASISFASPCVKNKSVWSIIKNEFFANRSRITALLLGGVIINVVALASAFFSMQVYDRVIPTSAEGTLLVLTIGVTLAVLYELLSKLLRSRLFDSLIDQMDGSLSYQVYRRLLDIRIDQLPSSVGSLAAQIRSYETIRGVLSQMVSSIMVDAPFVIIFIAIIISIDVEVVWIPVAFMFLSIFIGLNAKKKVDQMAQNAIAANNYKTGLLVESVEGIETIKSGQGGWRMLARWVQTGNEARNYEHRMNKISENAKHYMGAIQQLAYITMVAFGATLVSSGSLTLGGLIAMSILMGRTLVPISSIASFLVQLAHAKAALGSLEKLWQLETDYTDIDQPVVLESVKGNYELRDVEVSYAEQRALAVQKLTISQGEKVAIIGPVGAGKSTLLRLLTGMFKPESGRVFIDDVDILHVSKEVLGEGIAYVPQEGRLFSGSLRENLILGLIDPGDEVILNTAKRTGLYQHLLKSHPKGLELPILEGGKGLSGGQKQLVHLTRAFLRRPNVWLLDEPSASIDKALEDNLIGLLKSELTPTSTLVLVTHKIELLPLVDRIVVVSNNSIVMDDTRDKVLDALANNSRNKKG